MNLTQYEEPLARSLTVAARILTPDTFLSRNTPLPPGGNLRIIARTGRKKETYGHKDSRIS